MIYMYISIKYTEYLKKKTKTKKQTGSNNFNLKTINTLEIKSLKFYLHLLNASFKYHRANCKILL